MAKSILVVDDEEDLRKTVRTVLETAGYDVVTAVNGDDCLKKIAKKKFDLVLLDIMMPGTPATQVVRRISGPKVAFLTAISTSEDERKKLLKEKVVADFIQKPFDIDDLLKRVERLLAG